MISINRLCQAIKCCWSGIPGCWDHVQNALQEEMTITSASPKASNPALSFNNHTSTSTSLHDPLSLHCRLAVSSKQIQQFLGLHRPMIFGQVIFLYNYRESTGTFAWLCISWISLITRSPNTYTNHDWLVLTASQQGDTHFAILYESKPMHCTVKVCSTTPRKHITVAPWQTHNCPP